jgi:hypothetical protein
MCASRDDSLRQFLVGEKQYKEGVVGIDNRKFGKNVKKATPGDPENCTLVETNPSALVGLPYFRVAGSKPDCSAMRKGVVKIITVDDITPNIQSIQSESYPVYKSPLHDHKRGAGQCRSTVPQISDERRRAGHSCEIGACSAA